ncbi:MAG: hypothetical protein QOE36_276 [Gaiellaceae bacterium]|jgi:hypothetical protein|nr:hypothetical protein [Gaiellaceae bacterium]
MRVPDKLLRSVVFVGAKRGEGFNIGGTGLFVGIPSEAAPDRSWIYLVTAKHNIIRARERGTVYVRANTPDEKGAMLEADEGWIFSTNPASDVAVLPIDVPDGVIPVTIPIQLFATDAMITRYGIGLGDDLTIIGLFKKREGRDRNLPIVRSGNIAAMPSDPLYDPNTALTYHAYLAEVRSIGGLSGSPVFVSIKGPELLPSGESVRVGAVRFILLGLIRGHWTKAEYEAGDFFESEVESFNTGIAIVSPIADVLEILESEALVKEREKDERDLRNAGAPIEDSALGDDSDESEFERFERLARRMVQVPKAELDEKRNES